MSSNFAGVTFENQAATPSDDAVIRRAILSDGILDGCELSYTGSTLTMAAGQMMICGRQVKHTSTQNWAVADETTGYARLLLTIDLTRTSTKDNFDQVVDTIEYASSIDGFASLVQEDINASGTKYQIVAAVVSLAAGGISAIVDRLGETGSSLGEAYAAIGVTYPAGATCTCALGNKTFTAPDTSGQALFVVPTAGQWLVKATSQTQEEEDTVSITTQGQVASVTLAFFIATIETTFPTDCTSVTCTKGDTIFSVPSGGLSSGSYTFNIPETGEWVLYCTNGTKEKTTTVNVTEETAYTVTLSFELILFNNGSYAPETGGWTGGGLGGSSTGGVQSNKLYALGYTGSSAKDGEGFFYTNQKVDLTPYSTLHFIVDSTTGNLNKFVGYGTTQMDQSGMASVAPESSTPTEFTVNIQSVSGAYYINGTAVGAGRQNYLYVSKVWLT